MSSKTTRVTLIIVGMVLLFLLSPYTSPIFPFINIIDVPSDFFGIIIPGSLPLFYCLMSLGTISVFIVPGVFAVLSFFSHKNSYINFFTTVVVIFFILDFSWIIYFWNEGIKYHGKYFTYMVMTENAVCFLFLYIFIALFCVRKITYLVHFLNFVLLLILIFFAFPWLSESI